jgi:hypothetical protein
MDKISNELISKLELVIDSLEEELGDIEGFEIKLEHQVDEAFAKIKEMNVFHLTKTKII